MHRKMQLCMHSKMHASVSCNVLQTWQALQCSADITGQVDGNYVDMSVGNALICWLMRHMACASLRLPQVIVTFAR